MDFVIAAKHVAQRSQLVYGKAQDHRACEYWRQVLLPVSKIMNGRDLLADKGESLGSGGHPRRLSSRIAAASKISTSEQNTSLILGALEMVVKDRNTLGVILYSDPDVMGTCSRESVKAVA